MCCCLISTNAFGISGIVWTLCWRDAVVNLQISLRKCHSARFFNNIICWVYMFVAVIWAIINIWAFGSVSMEMVCVGVRVSKVVGSG